MNIIQAIILGIIQGLTEFLPVSSSAHLVIVPFLFSWSLPEAQVFPFDVLVQLGTLAAVILYFWKDLWTILKNFVAAIGYRRLDEPKARMGWLLILATIPAGIFGLLVKNQVEAAFHSPTITAVFLVVTASLLLVAELLGKRQRSLESLGWLDAIWIGIFQALSIFPGISRSGSTITGGMTRHLDRPSAARFSFLMSVPVMLAAGLLELKDLLTMPGVIGFLPILAAGFITAAIVGYLSIHWLLSFIAKHSLIYFSVYCVLLAAATLVIAYVR